MESAPLLIDQQGQPESSSSSGWVLEPDEETNGTSGWHGSENIPFFFLAQPPPGENFDRIEREIGDCRLIGWVRRTATEVFEFQGGQTVSALKWYPDKIISKYWHEASEPSHTIAGRTVTVNVDDPQYALTITYEYLALQIKVVPPATQLAEGKEYLLLLDIFSR